MLQQLISHTPIWIWVLLAFLITRGVAAMKPGKTSLSALAVVPVLFTAWGLWSIIHRYDGSWDVWGEWLLGIVVGMGAGWMLLRHVKLSINTPTGTLCRSADYSLLPLLLVTFAVKYGFESALAVSPALGLVLSGGFTGIFIGRYLRYLVAWRRTTVGGKLEMAE